MTKNGNVGESHGSTTEVGQDSGKDESKEETNLEL